MKDITEIMDMLDWSNPPDVQLQGRLLAKNIENLAWLMQPLTPKRSKSIWENCAIIIADKDDLMLEPYLTEMFEWLQDMNWPGAFLIWERLGRMSKESLQFAYEASLEKAIQTDDECWKDNLLDFWKEIEAK